MINDLKDLRFLNIINSLIHFIVIHKNYFFLVHVQEITSGNCSDTFSMRIDYRECSVAVFDHNILDIICEIFGIESNHVIPFHNIADRNTLIDQTGDIKGIIR